jgi:hypothetical protein
VMLLPVFFRPIDSRAIQPGRGGCGGSVAGSTAAAAGAAGAPSAAGAGTDFLRKKLNIDLRCASGWSGMKGPKARGDAPL